MRVQEDVGWDKKKFPEPNLHVYVKDNTQIMVYSMRRSPRKKGSEKHQKKTREIITEGGELCS